MKYRLACLAAAIFSSALIGCGSKKTEVASAGAAASSDSGGMSSGPAVRGAPAPPAGSTGQESSDSPASGPAAGGGSSGGPPALEAAGAGGGSAAPASAPSGGGSSGGPPALEAAGAGGGDTDTGGATPAGAGSTGGASSGPMLGFGAPGSTGGGGSIGTGVGGGNLLGSTGNESESGGPGVGFPGGGFPGGGLPGSGGQGNSQNPSSAPSIPAVELTLEDRAVLAFQAGNAPRAYALYQAHWLHVPNDETQNMADKYRWDKKRIVPRSGYSFAVGLIVKKTPQVKELKPIGTPLSELTSSSNGSAGPSGGAAPPGLGFAGGGGSEGSGSGTSAPAGVRNLPAKELSDAAGNYAAAFVEAFNKAHSDGKWSEAFREYSHGSISLPPSLSGLSGLLSGGGGGLGGGLGGSGFGGGSFGGPGGPPTGGGPPAGYSGGGAGGPPAGYSGGGAGGPPAGYSGGGAGGPPAGYGGGAPAGSKPGTKFLPAPQVGLGAAGGGPGAGAMGLRGGVPGSPGPGAGPGFGAAGPGAGLQLGAPGGPGGGFAGFGQGSGGEGAASGPSLSNLQSLVKNFNAKDIQLPSGSIALGSGLVYIGSSESIGDLTKRANEQHYDGLIVFEVDASMIIANRSIKNDCRIRAINLKAAKDAKDKAFTSSSLNNREIAADKNPETKIENAVNSFMQKLMDAYALEDLPNLPAESVKKKRLPALAADTSRTVLDRLAEVQLYFSKGIIDETLKVDAFGAIAGPDGQVLATGTDEEKRPILDKIIKRDYE